LKQLVGSGTVIDSIQVLFVIVMIWLTEDTKRLIKRLEAGVDKEMMLVNWKKMIEMAPLHSGSPEEEKAVQLLKEKFEEYGLECQNQLS